MLLFQQSMAPPERANSKWQRLLQTRSPIAITYLSKRELELGNHLPTSSLP
jgi:hypothetical protein